MGHMQNRSQLLRKCAAKVVDALIASGKLAAAQRPDLVTSLVRQWLTYDGKALLFCTDCEMYYEISWPRAGKLVVDEDRKPLRWIDSAMRDWKIDPKHRPHILEQLSLAQNAEVVSEGGTPIRIWVDPQRRRTCIEPLEPLPQRRGRLPKPNYERMAADVLADHLPPFFPEKDIKLLAKSVVRQWRTYDGAASIFLPRQELQVRLQEHEDGSCMVSVQRVRSRLESHLRRLGFSPHDVLAAISLLNEGKLVPFIDCEGRPSELWHDPSVRRIEVRHASKPPRAGLAASSPPHSRPAPQRSRRSKPGPAGPRPPVPGTTPPVFCPQCNAVLVPWEPHQRAQTCSACGYEVTLL